MNKQFALLLAILITAFNAFCQDTPIPEGYKLRVSPNIIYVYRNINDKPDFTIRNRWNNIYWFKVDNTAKGKYEDSATKENYIRIMIPSSGRYDDSAKNDLGQPGPKWVYGDEAKAYNLTIGWKGEDIIDGSDFNTWLWISRKDFDTLKTAYSRMRIKGAFVLSALTVPFKYRPSIGNQSNSVINGDLNLGSFIGLRLTSFIPKWDLGMSIGGHFGISSISLNAANNTSIAGDKTETIQGFTYGAGIIFDIKKEFQLGVVLGRDYGVGNLAKTYVYQKRNWFSFSLNYNFLNSKKDKGDTNQKEGKKADKEKNDK